MMTEMDNVHWTFKIKMKSKILLILPDLHIAFPATTLVLIWQVRIYNE